MPVGPGTGSSRETSLTDELQSYKLPATPEFAAICHWHKQDSRQVFLLNVESDWPVFAGHFPHQPILPGIMQVHWAVQFAQVFMGKSASPIEIKQLKFRNIFIPPGRLELELSALSGHELSFKFCSALNEPDQAELHAQVHAQGRLRYAK
ncbi:MAG: hypothetical protein SH820_04465 [Xanthomonadales bacterium]|nr:hypothetical protein [Xanthomonadales bacterium]